MLRYGSWPIHELGFLSSEDLRNKLPIGAKCIIYNEFGAGESIMESSVVTVCCRDTNIHTEIHIKLCGVLASRRRAKRQMKIRLDLFTLEERGGKDLRNVYKLFPTFHQLWLQFHQNSGAQGEPIARK